MKKNEIRIISGKWKRTKLIVKEPARPTSNIIRETLFNWLGQDLTDLICLDAFAGSGALGFEAASRNAKEVILLEKKSLLIKYLNETINKLNANKVIKTKHLDALTYLNKIANNYFDIIFLDPPFSDYNLLVKSLNLSANKINKFGFIYLETNKKITEIISLIISLNLNLYRHLKSGITNAYLLKLN